MTKVDVEATKRKEKQESCCMIFFLSLVLINQSTVMVIIEKIQDRLFCLRQM